MQLTGGYIACSIVTTGPNSYLDQQLQQWGWTNNPLIQITTSNQIFNITWSVTGSGSKFISQSSTDPNGRVHTLTSSLAWTENGSMPGQLQVRIANNSVILTNVGTIALAMGLTGTREDRTDGMMPMTSVITNAVPALPLPAVQWNGPLPIDRLAEGSLEPGAVGSPSRREIGSRLGHKVASRNVYAYAGSQLLPNPQPTGVQYAGATSTANWSWRISY